MLKSFVVINHFFWIRFIVSIVTALFFIFLDADSIVDVIKGKYFLADFLAGFTLTFLLLTYLSWLMTYLDGEYPWHERFTSRLFYQLTAGVIIPSVLTLAYMATYFFVVQGFEKEEVQFFYNEFPVSVLLFILINTVYVVLNFYRQSKIQKARLQVLQAQLFTVQNVASGKDILRSLKEQPEETITAEEVNEIPTAANSANKIKVLVVVSGNKNIPISIDDIAYIYKEENFTQLKTFGAATYMMNHSLDELMKLLDASQFFRVNRQVVINLKACHYFTNEEGGKLELHLQPAFDQEVFISQKRATQFRDWLNR